MLGLGKTQPYPAAMEKWKEQLEYFLGSKHHPESYGTDGEPYEFEWSIFPGHTTVELLRDTLMRRTTRGIKSEEFEDRIMFMPMYHDIKTNPTNVSSNSLKVRDYARRFQKGHWSFLSLVMMKNGMERTSTNLNESGIAPQM